MAREVTAARIPLGFLRDPTIQTTMFVDVRGAWLEQQRAELIERLGRARYLAMVQEDHAGLPVLAAWRDLTSHNSIHHPYHFARYARATGADLAGVDSVVEWGGGYGNQAKIFSRVNPSVTYTIIDTPLLCTLQWCYLSSVLGVERVHLMGDENLPLRDGAVNLLPVSLVERLAFTAELFISTWALSESTAAANDLVAANGWFGAERLLIGFQEGTGCRS